MHGSLKSSLFSSKSFFKAEISNSSEILGEFTLSSSSMERGFLNEYLLENVELCVDHMIFLIKSEEYEEGIVGRAQQYMEELISKNLGLFRESFQKVWVELLKMKRADLIGNFINVAASIDYNFLDDKADVLIMGSWSIDDLEVNDSVIRAVEAWSQKHHADLLEQVKPSDVSWLESYRKNVMEYLERL